MAGRLRCVHGERIMLEKVRNYIANQEAHHRKKTFQEEYVEFLKSSGVEFDERYLW